MLRFLRQLTCLVFEHELAYIVGETSLETLAICTRCNVSLKYEFEVEDGFWEKHFGDDGENPIGIPK